MSEIPPKGDKKTKKRQRVDDDEEEIDRVGKKEKWKKLFNETREMSKNDPYAEGRRKRGLQIRGESYEIRKLQRLKGPYSEEVIQRKDALEKKRKDHTRAANRVNQQRCRARKEDEEKRKAEEH
jgi:hypothetical protein